MSNSFDGRKAWSWCRDHFFKKIGQPWPLLSIIFSLFQTNIITIFTTNMYEKLSIQYPVLGFESTTFGT